MTTTTTTTMMMMIIIIIIITLTDWGRSQDKTIHYKQTDVHSSQVTSFCFEYKHFGGRGLKSRGKARAPFVERPVMRLIPRWLSSNDGRILSDIGRSCSSRAMRSVTAGHQAVNLPSSNSSDTRVVSVACWSPTLAAQRTVPVGRTRSAVLTRPRGRSELMLTRERVANGRLMGRLRLTRYPNSRSRNGLKIARSWRWPTVRRRRSRTTDWLRQVPIALCEIRPWQPTMHK